MRMRMGIGCLLLVLGIGIPNVYPAEAPPTTSPGVVIRVASLDQLIKGLVFVAEQAGKGEVPNQVEKLLKSLTGEKGLEGIDLKRPFGFYGQLTEGVIDSVFAVVIPIADEAAAIGHLDRLQLRGEKQEDGCYKVEIPNSPVPAYYRFANKSVYITVQNPANVAVKKLLPPEKALPVDSSLIGLTIQIDQIPEKLRKLALGQVEMKLAQAKKQKIPGETAAQNKLRLKSIDLGMHYLHAALEEGKSLHLGLQVNPEGNDLGAALSFTAKDGTPSAMGIGALGQLKGIGTSLSSGDNAIQAFLHAGLPDSLREVLGQVVDEALAKIPLDHLDDGPRGIAEQAIKAITPTLKMGEIDLGASLRRVGKQDLYTFVAGMKIKDGAGIEKTIKEIVKKAPEPLEKIITVDADKVGEVNIHKVVLPHQPPSFAKFYGDGPIFVAIREDALLLAFGEDALAALKKVVAAQSQVTKPIQLDIAINQIAPLLAMHDPNVSKAAAEAFTQTPPQDKLSLFLQGGKSLRLQVNLMGPVLHFIALTDELKRKEP